MKYKEAKEKLASLLCLDNKPKNPPCSELVGDERGRKIVGGLFTKTNIYRATICCWVEELTHLQKNIRFECSQCVKILTGKGYMFTIFYPIYHWFNL